MTTYNTGNSIGSADPRDLYDNAENLDNAANSDSTTWTDRLGQPRRTMAGIEQDAINAIQNAGYVGTGTDNAVEDYAAGIEITQYNQIVRDGGEFWRPSADTTLPYTTTGAGMPEGGAFVNVGDGVLRQVLVQPVATFNSVADMKDSANLDVGRKARTLGYYEPGDGGGNDYEIVASGTGTDDGGSFIDLSGSGLQAKGIFSGTLDPAKFGAIGDGRVGANRDTGTDVTFQLNKAMSYWANTSDVRTLSGQGRVYNISGTLTVPSTPTFMTGKRFTDFAIQVRSDFAGGPIIDMTPVTVSRRTSFDNLYLLGGLADQMSEAKGGIHFADIAGAVLSFNEMRFIDGSFIKVTGTGAAGESHFIGNRLFGGSPGTGNANAIGIELDKGDCEITENIIATMSIAQVYLRAGAVGIRGNHLWGQDGDNGVVHNIYTEKAEQTIIVGNYIDNGPIRIGHKTDAPNNVIINSNKFVCNNESAPAWIANTPLQRGFIEIATEASGVVMRSVSVQGNNFSTPHSETFDVMTMQCWNPNGFSSNLKNVYVKDNTQDEHITVRTTHPRRRVSFSSTDKIEVDMNASSELVRRLPGPWGVTYATSCVYQSTSDAVINRISRSADLFTVHLGTSTSGDIILTVSSNEDGA